MSGDRKKGKINYFYHDGDEYVGGSFGFEYTCPEDQVEQNWRDAIADYLTTTEGQKVALEENGGDFNWGDAINYVPDDILEEYGLYSVGDGVCFSFDVAHDENFADELEEEDDAS